MLMENDKIYVGIAALFIKDNHVLLLRRSASIYLSGTYCLPGGHVDGKETLRQAIAREVQEEVGLKIKPTDAQFIHVYHSYHATNAAKKEWLGFIFLITTWEGEPINMEPDKHDQLCWAPLDNLPGNIVKVHYDAIKAYRDNVYYLEHGWE